MSRGAWCRGSTKPRFAASPLPSPCPVPGARLPPRPLWLSEPSFRLPASGALGVRLLLLLNHLSSPLCCDRGYIILTTPSQGGERLLSPRSAGGTEKKDPCFQKAAGFDLLQAAAEQDSHAPPAQLHISVFVLSRKTFRSRSQKLELFWWETAAQHRGSLQAGIWVQTAHPGCSFEPCGKALPTPQPSCFPALSSLLVFRGARGRFSWRKAFYSSSFEAV